MYKDILFFVKFGEKKHLESMLKGELYFSNAKEYRKIEEEQLLKGQGDCYDSMCSLKAKKVTLENGNSIDNFIQLFNKSFNIDFGDNGSKATFCLTAGTKQNCSYYKDENHYTVNFSKAQANTIREQFPKADSALLIKNSSNFIGNVIKNIGYDCCYDKVLYYNKEHLTTELFSFINESTSDWETIVLTDKNIHRFILCKDVFFQQQQEFRFVLYKKKIAEPQIFCIPSIEDGQIYSLEDFFKGVQVSY